MEQQVPGLPQVAALGCDRVPSVVAADPAGAVLLPTQRLLGRVQDRTGGSVGEDAAGVGGQAGRLILIDRPAMIETADRLGLFIWGETS